MAPRLMLIAVFSVIYSGVNSQDSSKTFGLFEGSVLYQYQILNPNPKLISDKEFYESIPNQGKSEVMMYVKGNKYRFEYPDRIEMFSPALGQVTTHSLKKDSISFFYVNQLDDSVKKVSKIESRESILGHLCEGIEVKAKWETRVFYFNPSQLKTNSSFWRNHLREFYANYFSKTSNFPLLMIRKSMLGNYEIRALRINKTAVSDDLFKLP